jgi:hypothetical protein
MSMGFLVPQDAPIAWRGLMVQKAMNQLLFEVAWPKLDLLVLDLPPGTGDVQLTITQSVELDGAVVVSTPQDLALRDAVRGIDFFGKTETRVLGMVQNMSTFTCTSCGTKHDVFGLDGEFPLFPRPTRYCCFGVWVLTNIQAQKRNARSSVSHCWATSLCIRRFVRTQMLANLRLSVARTRHKQKPSQSSHKS